MRYALIERVIKVGINARIVRYAFRKRGFAIHKRIAQMAKTKGTVHSLLNVRLMNSNARMDDAYSSVGSAITTMTAVTDQMNPMIAVIHAA